MTKTYFNNAIIGNSRMLGCLTGRGELVRLFWPNIDYPQHIEKMLIGYFDTAFKDSTVWLNDERLQCTQYYTKDTNILNTLYFDNLKGLEILQRDYVLPDKDVLIRQYEIENKGNHEIDLGFILYSSCVTSTPDLRSTLFDFANDALIHYRHDYYISISSNAEVHQFQLGNNAFDNARHTELNGYDNIGMMQDGALSWKLGRIMPGEKKSVTLNICASNTLKGVKRLVQDINNSDLMKEREKTEEYWADFLKTARHYSTGITEIDNLYNRSLLVFKLMADERSGGLLAAPEIDEGFTRCGRYAYCWGRDAAFITEALDKCGLVATVEKFYEWAVEVQDEEGSWQQRYYMDGNLAPSWGLQIDETASIIWGMLKHYESTKDMAFLNKVWRSVEKGIGFILGFIDSETGLPKPSYDLWEERIGEHAYSSAAVCGGIKAAVQMAKIIDAPSEIIGLWEKAWVSLKEAILKNFWKEDRKCFIRSIRTKLNPWGRENSDNTIMIKVNQKGYLRDVTLEDWMIDISLLGVCIPFDVFKADDYRVSETVEAIERALTSPKVGGIKRYESDNYIGGNPWILTTLWVALYYIERKDYDKAKSYFDWAVKARTPLDLLPEQVGKDSGEPEWVIPLTWSHAMFVLVFTQLFEAGIF